MIKVFYQSLPPARLPPIVKCPRQLLFPPLSSAASLYYFDVTSQCTSATLTPIEMGKAPPVVVLLLKLIQKPFIPSNHKMALGL